MCRATGRPTALPPGRAEGRPSPSDASRVGRGLRPLAKAGTAQRGEWPRSAASSGGHGARGAPPGRGLALPGPAGEGAKKRCPNAQLATRRSLRRVPALPAPCRARTRAGPVTGDDLETVDVTPHSPVHLPLTRDRGKIRGRIGGRRGETRPRTRGEKKDVSEKISSESAPSLPSARQRRFYGIYQPVSLRNCVVLWRTVGGGATQNGRDRFTHRDGLT